MENKKLNIVYEVHPSLDEMKKKERETARAAMNAVKSAYAPYSNFQVGAAVLLDNGKIITGSNQENAAYPSGMCAERVALFYAGAKYPDASVKLLAITAMKDESLTSQVISPCGACRQSISETAFRSGGSFPVILIGKEQIIKIPNSNDLLPFLFGPEML